VDEVAGCRYANAGAEAALVRSVFGPGSRLHEARWLLDAPEHLFLLDALNHSERAPGHVIVDRGYLMGAPGQRDDREAPVGLAVERVAGNTPRRRPAAVPG